MVPVLRAIRTHGRQRFDVYGRFGLLYGGQALRRHAFDLLSERSDFGHEVSLFRYPGGPDKVPYRRYLFEVARAKVCIDLPGKGDLTTRLIDYLAIGSCVVRPPPHARLPDGLIDGVHVVYCAPDLSDLGDICAELVRDTSARELIAENARDYFDRHLHREQIAHYHVAEITDAAARALGSHAPVAAPHELEHPVRKPVGATRFALAVAAALLVALVLLPELLGDRPYNPIGRNSRHTLRHASLPQPAAPWQLDGRRGELRVDVAGGPAPLTTLARA
jgi:Glycosyl transferases group 1